MRSLLFCSESRMDLRERDEVMSLVGGGEEGARVNCVIVMWGFM